MEFDRVWNELVDWLSVLLMLEAEDGVAEILEGWDVGTFSELV